MTFTKLQQTAAQNIGTHFHMTSVGTVPEDKVKENDQI
jgi:hypothetical protein